jgi:hypothetical protein
MSEASRSALVAVQSFSLLSQRHTCWRKYQTLQLGLVDEHPEVGVGWYLGRSLVSRLHINLTNWSRRNVDERPP